MKSHRTAENVCNYISDKGLSTVNDEKKNLIRKCIKGRNKYLTKEDGKQTQEKMFYTTSS